MARMARVLGLGVGVISISAVAAFGCGSDDETGSSGRGESDAAPGGATGGSGGSGGSAGGSTPVGGSGGADVPDASTGCGNATVEPPEECDDGNDSEQDECLNDCTLACGNGVLDGAETCDTAIAAGDPGACPTSCESTDPCLSVSLSGSECSQVCEQNPITAEVNGDGCCPDGSSSLDDDDCMAECGNGVVERGESCDTTIASGETGACPSVATCDDNDACTVNGVSGDGTCSAACDYSEAVLADLSTPDGCCPQGATDATDADCDPLCGNGQLDGSEVCDPGISSGDGVCITSCPDDGDACTVETLSTANPCDPVCNTTTITAPSDGDGCCPGGANANNDADCSPVCGNGVKETGEDCDETSAQCDQCQFVPTAFRFTSLEVKDPHLYLECQDVTAAVNTVIADAIASDTSGGDAGGDGLFDLSLLLIFRPLEQVTSPGNLDFVEADCLATGTPTSCSPQAGATPQSGLYDNSSTGTCLGALMGTTSGYMPAVVETTAGANGCFVTRPDTVTLNLGGIEFVFTDARLAAEYNSADSTQLLDGLIRGFISEAQAEMITIPLGDPPPPLSDFLPGSTTHSCTTDPGFSVDDRDTLADGTSGWWFYLNFTAERVDWTGG